MAGEDLLRTYRDKRDFNLTPEPVGGEAGDEPRFVIQKHDASSLHYDFRLEADGVLKSWAVPKGPSTDPREKRLAIRTEDHPIDYLYFEGVIPKGEYGGGTVIVWDTGTYRNLTEGDGRPLPVSEAVEKGHVVVRLEGHKLTGGFALTRTSFGGDPRKWILVKMDDNAAEARLDATDMPPESVLSGRSNEELAKEDARKASRS